MTMDDRASHFGQYRYLSLQSTFPNLIPLSAYYVIISTRVPVVVATVGSFMLRVGGCSY